VFVHRLHVPVNIVPAVIQAMKQDIISLCNSSKIPSVSQLIMQQMIN
jgi:hypothetical protein